jgi:DNA-binding GntR family transcriptional regulator
VASGKALELAAEADPTRAGRNGHTGRSNSVYQRLREEILHGLLRPNERLIEAEIADRLRVSRTPVREGLHRLAVEGLVVSRRRGWVVYEHSSGELIEIYEARAALEGYASALAAARATEVQLDAIAAIIRDSDGIILSPRAQLVDVNDKFHDAIIDAAGNQRIRGLIHRNRSYYFNYQIANLYTDEEAAHSRTQHEQVVEALLQRDARRAEEITREHIGQALRVVLAKIR